MDTYRKVGQSEVEFNDDFAVGWISHRRIHHLQQVWWMRLWLGVSYLAYLSTLLCPKKLRIYVPNTEVCINENLKIDAVTIVRRGGFLQGFHGLAEVRW